MIEAYPLQWPLGWPRTKRPQRSAFKTTLGRARDELHDELRLLGARHVVISSNAPLRKDGEFYASFKGVLDDPAVAVYFTLNGAERCIPCDKWDRLQDNVRALCLTVAALRGLDRWGAKEMVNAAFQGFQALPEGGKAGWWTVLDVQPTAEAAEIETAYRRLAKQHHPDMGGNADTFHAVQEAYRLAKGGK